MGRNRWGIAGGLAAFAVSCGAGTAHAALPHVVQPGETLWSISVANNLTTRTVAVFNGIAEDAHVVEGTTIQVPTVDEGAAALAAAGVTAPAPEPAVAEPVAPEGGAPPPDPGATYGLGHVTSPWGSLHLDPAAADAWNAMRDESLASYGVDLYPGGPVSAFRTYEQQSYLYDLYLAGQGAPANPPGSSAHEMGVAVDVATEDMRYVIDQIGAAYGWYAPHADEWWHVEYWG